MKKITEYLFGTVLSYFVRNGKKIRHPCDDVFKKEF